MDTSSAHLPLPEHPELREIALAFEAAGMMCEIQDASFRSVFISTEAQRLYDLSPEEVRALLGRSDIWRVTRGDARLWRTTEESGGAWLAHNAPIMRHFLNPGDPEFDEVFAGSAESAGAIEPVERAPRAWFDRITFPGLWDRVSFGSQAHQIRLRVNDDRGEFIGVVLLLRGTVPDTLLLRLTRGDQGLFERMDRVSEPARRPAAILFADLEASGVLSRRLSSRAYFDLIRDLTDLVDTAVVEQRGIVGKHAGDGASALFLSADFDGSESSAARAAIEAARSIRDGGGHLRPEDGGVAVNIGLHWGATLTVGQVSGRGRLEVTALGDQMNEAARIEAAAKGGALLASKDLIERLAPEDAQAAGVDPDSVVYVTVKDLDGASEKVIRDAGAIAVAAL